MRPRALALALPALLAACLDGPAVGPPLTATCDDADLDPARATHYRADVEAGVFGEGQLACGRCHLPGGATPVGIDVGGLDLSSYATLRAGGVSGPDLIVPGEPCASLLYLKLTAAPPAGGRMPLGGPLFASPAQLAVVHDWIAEGARDD